jgi:hypothetical protein
MEPRNATADDAKLILKLYDLRREPLMRKARDFVNQFFPQSADEFLRLMQAWGTEENAYVRQVVSYWDMAASLVLRGALHEELFLDSAGEMLFTYAKLHPFLAEIRERLGIAEFLRNMETLLNRSETGRTKLKATLERVKVISEMRKNMAKS